jgi:hypothetical protein
MEVKGTVYAIGATTSKDHNGKTYKERQIVIQVDEQYNGQTYSQYIPILGKRDTIIGFMDSLKIGQMVTAHCNLRGVKYMKDNAERFFGSIEVYKIDAAASVADDTPTTNAMAGNTGTVSDLPF